MRPGFMSGGCGVRGEVAFTLLAVYQKLARDCIATQRWSRNSFDRRRDLLHRWPCTRNKLAIVAPRSDGPATPSLGARI